MLQRCLPKLFSPEKNSDICYYIYIKLLLTHPNILKSRSIENKQKYIPPDITYAKEEFGTNLSDPKISRVGFEIPRSIPFFKNSVQSVGLYVFGDASKTGVCAAVYAIVKQTEGSSKSLLASKRSKKDLSLPKLEFLARPYFGKYYSSSTLGVVMDSLTA